MTNSREAHAANRLGLDYKAEAEKFTKLPFGIIDAHSHINGTEASSIYKVAARLYGISLTYSMTHLENIPALKKAFAGSLRFIAMPRFTEEEQFYNDVPGYIKHIEEYYAHGARIIKFWSAPRGIDIGIKAAKTDMLKLNSPRRKQIMKEIQALKMVFMVHIGDPDTWFLTKYLNSDVYGSKRFQYKQLEEVLDLFEVPFIAAHMGGWPEDLEFLSYLLTKHPNLYLDSSATKWMVRELSKYPRDELIDFFRQWKDRILFGSDIVSNDTHLVVSDEAGIDKHLELQKREQVFELYASRYWALRSLFESNYDGESPIADPDLAMLEPEKHSEMDAPLLQGKNLPQDILRNLYCEAAHNLLEPYHKNL